MPGSENQSATPPVFWAQRKDLIYLLINVTDCEKSKIKVDKEKLYFRARGGTDKLDYEVTLEFLNEINPDASKHAIRGRGAEFVLMKAADGPYWERLLKDKKKHHWLKIDFNKWQNEDSDEEEKEDNFEEMMKAMGGLNSAGNGNLADLEDDEESEEEEQEN